MLCYAMLPTQTSRNRSSLFVVDAARITVAQRVKISPGMKSTAVSPSSAGDDTSMMRAAYRLLAVFI